MGSSLWPPDRRELGIVGRSRRHNQGVSTQPAHAVPGATAGHGGGGPLPPTLRLAPPARAAHKYASSHGTNVPTKDATFGPGASGGGPLQWGGMGAPPVCTGPVRFAEFGDLVEPPGFLVPPLYDMRARHATEILPIFLRSRRTQLSSTLALRDYYARMHLPAVAPRVDCRARGHRGFCMSLRTPDIGKVPWRST